METRSKPIKIKARSIWHGKVGIHSKYFEKAIQENLGMEIHYQNEYMVMSPEQVSSTKERSKETFTDKFKGTSYYLVYYKWKPNVVQGTLL